MPSPYLSSPYHGQYLNGLSITVSSHHALKTVLYPLNFDWGWEFRELPCCVLFCVCPYSMASFVFSEDRMCSALGSIKQHCHWELNWNSKLKIVCCIINIVFFQQENSSLLVLCMLLWYTLCLPKAFLLSLPPLFSTMIFHWGKIKDLKCLFDCRKTDTLI